MRPHPENQTQTDTPKYRISIGYPMKRVELTPKRRIEIDGVEGFLVRKVTKFGNSAKVDCPKQYVGRTAYLVIV